MGQRAGAEFSEENLSDHIKGTLSMTICFRVPCCVPFDKLRPPIDILTLTVLPWLRLFLKWNASGGGHNVSYDLHLTYSWQLHHLNRVVRSVYSIHFVCTFRLMHSLFSHWLFSRRHINIVCSLVVRR